MAVSIENMPLISAKHKHGHGKLTRDRKGTRLPKNFMKTSLAAPKLEILLYDNTMISILSSGLVLLKCRNFRPQHWMTMQRNDLFKV